MEFMMIVSTPDIAKYMEKFSNVTLFVDFEVLGKEDRQGHLDTVKSDMTLEQLKPIRKAAPNSKILARINPINQNTFNEIESVIKYGADSIMLPMFSSFDEVDNFFRIIDGRVLGIPLFETSASITLLPEIISKIPLKQCHIGLNDLHLDQQKNFIFEPLADGFLEKPAKLLRKSNIKFGIGGIAKVGDGLVPAENIIGEHTRLGSKAVILSRSFNDNKTNIKDFLDSINIEKELEKITILIKHYNSIDKNELEKNKSFTWKLIKEVSSQREKL